MLLIKSNFWLKLALFDLDLENLQMRQEVAIFETLPYLARFLVPATKGAVDYENVIIPQIFSSKTLKKLFPGV